MCRRRSAWVGVFGLGAFAVFASGALAHFAAVAHAQTKSSSDWPTRLGPAEVDTGAGYLALGFAGQLQGAFESADTGDGAGSDQTFRFLLRRVRFYPRGRFLDDRLRFAMQLSTAPSSLELMDYWFDWRFNPFVSARLGQFKVPLSRYRQQSFTGALLVDWANVSSYFGAERQLGLMLHNGGSEPRFEYALALLSGQNARGVHGAGVFRAYGEPRPNPSNLRDPAPLDDWHPELMLRVAHNSEGVDSRKPSDDRRTGLRHTEGLSVAWDMDPVDGQDFAWRIVPEVMLKAYGASLILAVYGGVIDMTQSDATELAMIGTLAEAAYRFDRFWELAARYSRVDLLGRLRDDAMERAQEIIDAAADDDVMADVQGQYASAGTLEADQELAVGINVYVVGTDMRWSTDAGWLRKYQTDGNHNHFQVRTQAQVAF